MVVLRSIAYLLLSLAFVFTVLDGIRSLAANDLVITPLGQLWSNLHAPSLKLFQAFFTDRGLIYLWDPVILGILQAPGFAVPALLALVLAWIGRKRPHKRKWIGEVE